MRQPKQDFDDWVAEESQWNVEDANERSYQPGFQFFLVDRLGLLGMPPHVLDETAAGPLRHFDQNCFVLLLFA